LLLDRAEIALAASLRGIAQQPEAVDAGFDIAKVLAKIVNQIDEDRFYWRSLG
jgi:hypothetical protein